MPRYNIAHKKTRVYDVEAFGTGTSKLQRHSP